MLKLKVHKVIGQDETSDGKPDVNWVARLFVDEKHVGTLEFDEIELVDTGFVLNKKEKE